MNTIHLKSYGLIPRFEQEATLYTGLFLARVTEQHRDLYNVICENGEILATVSGKLAYNAGPITDYPAVGDWVMIDTTDQASGNAIIHHILGRKSVFERKAAGTSHTTQIVASNIDIVFICMSLNADFNLRRLERYLSIAWDSLASPVIVLTKADLCDDVDARIAEVTSVSLGTEVVVCSSMEEDGYQNVLSYISEGVTIAFIGSSGVGKTTLINRLIGRDVFTTKEIRDDDKGRHATTRRQLILLPGGGVVIDTPGMRELHLDSANLSASFEDIEELAGQCKFSDCSHSQEPGCAIRAAIEAGSLSEKRFGNYKKLKAEASYEGLNSRQLEEAKIKKMFNSKKEMMQVMRRAKKKNER